MQRILFLIAYFFICVNCFAQLAESRGQYPFVHYTPKDGLISNSIRSIYQDSRGRLYFTSGNGLSVYDGSRFINYTSQNGLGQNIVNQVMEMGDDSIWVVTNIGKINCLVNGKIKEVELGNIPIINFLYKDEQGTIYAASEQGLFFLEKNRFVRLPFVDTDGNDVNRHLSYILPFGDYLLIQRDNALTLDLQFPLYLYNKTTKKITSKILKIYSASIAPDKRLWVSTEKNIMALDTIAINKGMFVLQELPQQFDQLKVLGRYFIYFDRGNNCWLGDNRRLIKATPGGHITSFTGASGLSMSFINFVYLDKEGSTWIATNNAGVDKLAGSNFLFLEKPFGLTGILEMSYSKTKDRLLLYSSNDSRAVIVEKNKPLKYLQVKKPGELSWLIETSDGFYTMWLTTIYKMSQSGNTLIPDILLTDTTDNTYSQPLVDKNGTLIICGKYYITAVKDGKIICRDKLNFFADYPVSDSKGNIWLATRDNELIMYRTWPDDHSNYLEKKFVFKKEITGVSPRSIIIDKNDNIWIGSRNHGIYVYGLKNGSLTRLFHIDKNAGLSDDFTAHLACDSSNNIWASSFTGLDRITISNGKPVIENLTRQNNIYQRVYKIIIDRDNTAWALVTNGIIRIIPESKKASDYSPSLMVSMVKAGKDTITGTAADNLTYKQNNLTFYFTATSFIDEKQVMYSYRLLGGSNSEWSEPSNIATVSFINLRPGDYTLEIKANFPASRYPENIINYKFSITPPWWGTWWFRSISGLLIIGLLIIGFRFYYRRKLEKRLAALEKQQAIEKERTRIATDMHDDLGSGLSRIKFLSQALSNKVVPDESIKTGLEKITGYSDEMTEKMGEIVWALNEKNDTLADLVAYTRSYAVEYLTSHNIQCDANTPLHLPGTFIPGEIRRNIFLSVKECLHNVVKHADATRVCFSVELNPGIHIVIYDNGKGIDWNNQRVNSNGIENIRQRMKEIKGRVQFLNEQGTKITLDIPSFV